MGKRAKSSRKGKKEWRANISTEDFEDFFEKTTKDALSGGSLAQASDESLYFVDKSRDLSVRRKIEKSRDKVLHCDSVLQKNPFVKAIPSSVQKKKKSKKDDTAVEPAGKDGSVPDSRIVDIWEQNGEVNRKTKKKTRPSIIPAVEVEPPGCSFNPHPESHQDALACAVADEMQKIYQDELGPEPIPSTVLPDSIDEEDKFFLDADDGTDDEDVNENPTENGAADAEKRPRKAERITQVQLNKRARHKERLKAEAEAKKAGKLSKEIDSLADIVKEIAKEDEEKHKRHLRRTVAKQERLKTRPPRLGKYKFDAAPMQVILSEEKTGSLRQLKGCCTLVKDRYKSLEKRGLIIPTRKSSRK